MIAGARPSAGLVTVGASLFLFSVQVTAACSQAIWQATVPLELQGRVFSMRGLVAFSSLPLAYLAAGPLAERVFVPLLASSGPLAGSVGRWVGIGPGRGIGLLFIVAGGAMIATTALALLVPSLRHVEEMECERPSEGGCSPPGGAGLGHTLPLPEPLVISSPLPCASGERGRPGNT